MPNYNPEIPQEIGGEYSSSEENRYSFDFGGDFPDDNDYSVSDSKPSEAISAWHKGDRYSPERESQTHYTGLQGIEEHWPYTENIDGRILEVGTDHVKLELLVDKEQNRFQDRIFPKDLLEGAVTLQEGNYILMRRFKGKGKIKFTFDNANNYVKNREAFEDKSRFDDLNDFDFDLEL